MSMNSSFYGTPSMDKEMAKMEKKQRKMRGPMTVEKKQMVKKWVVGGTVITVTLALAAVAVVLSVMWWIRRNRKLSSSMTSSKKSSVKTSTVQTIPRALPAFQSTTYSEPMRDVSTALPYTQNYAAAEPRVSPVVPSTTKSATQKYRSVSIQE